jgi:hypothetical protein
MHKKGNTRYWALLFRTISLGGAKKMLLRKTDLLSVLTSLSLPVIQHAGMLQLAVGCILFIPTCLVYLISRFLKEYGIKFCDSKTHQALVDLRKQANEPYATGIVGGLK